MRERFLLDSQQNILFINFAGLRIESREQVDEMEEIIHGIHEKHGRRFYAIVNYEGTEISPEIIGYYGERIKMLYELYGIATVRYSSSGFTRSVLRYLGAAMDLESNTFATRAEAIRAIHEVENRSRGEVAASVWSVLNPARSIMGRLLAVWSVALLALFAIYLTSWNSHLAAPLLFLSAMLGSGAVLFSNVVAPLLQMERFARRLVGGGPLEPLKIASRDETGRLALALNETAKQVRRDIQRLSGLYHISLLMGTGTEASRIAELLTRKIARLLDAEMCVILLYDEHEQSVYAQQPGYGVSDEQLRLLRSKLGGKSIAAWVIKTGEPYLTNDAANDPLINRAAADLLGAREMLAVPLQAGESTFGALEVINKPGGFLEEDRQLVTIFASQAAQILANAQHLEKERQLAQHLITSERLAAIGELVAGVAHEVRNPLCGITTTLSALARKLEDREAVRPFLDVINTEVDHLNHLMEQLLEHSSPARLSAEAADIREVIHEAIAEFRTQAEARKIDLSCDLTVAAPGMRLDRRKMHRVFTNLLDNAIQHTGAGGLVRIAICEINSAANGDEGGRLQIEVNDTGSGIAPEDLGRVFEPFFTTRARGTGLGLAITRKTIHDHGGTITVKSEQGKGTSFIIRLPLEICHVSK
jgi:signal transduction histidine kinase